MNGVIGTAHVIGSMAARSQNTGESLPVPLRACCRCNRNGRCRNCVCCKERRRCVFCLPGRLGRCENHGGTLSPGESSDTLSSADESEDNILGGDFSPNSVTNNQLDSDDDPSSPQNFLPSFNVMCSPSFMWGDVPGESFVHSVTCCYDEVVHWRKALFKSPLAKCGRAFVTEQARLFRAYATGSAFESVALKAAMIMPVLLLQQPHAKSKD